MKYFHVNLLRSCKKIESYVIKSSAYKKAIEIKVNVNVQ